MDADPAASRLAALPADVLGGFRGARLLRHDTPRRFLSTVPVTLEVWGLEPQTYGLQSHRSSH